MICLCISLGCDTGFGSRLAKELDSHGFQVFAGCLNVDCDGAQQLKSSCSKLLHLVQLDVTKPVQITTAVEVVQSSLGERSISLKPHRIFDHIISWSRELKRFKNREITSGITWLDWLIINWYCITFMNYQSNYSSELVVINWSILSPCQWKWI